MIYSEIKQQYPKSAELLHKFYKTALEEMRHQMLADMKEQMVIEEDEEEEKDLFFPEIENETIGGYLESLLKGSNLKDLFTFFDKNNIFTVVKPLRDSTPHWVWTIEGIYHSLASSGGKNFDNRLLAEHDAFQEAFKILEDALNHKEEI